MRVAPIPDKSVDALTGKGKKSSIGVSSEKQQADTKDESIVPKQQQKRISDIKVLRELQNLVARSATWKRNTLGTALRKSKEDSHDPEMEIRTLGIILCRQIIKTLREVSYLLLIAAVVLGCSVIQTRSAEANLAAIWVFFSVGGSVLALLSGMPLRNGVKANSVYLVVGLLSVLWLHNFNPVEMTTGQIIATYGIILVVPSCVAIQVSCMFFYSERKRLTLPALFHASMTHMSVLVAGMIYACFIQWIFSTPDLSSEQEILLVGFLFPTLQFLLGRVVVGDFLSFLAIQCSSPDPNGDWALTSALQIRGHFCTMAKVVSAFPSMLTLLYVRETSTFVISLTIAALIELASILGWFLITSVVANSKRGQAMMKLKEQVADKTRHVMYESTVGRAMHIGFSHDSRTASTSSQVPCEADAGAPTPSNIATITGMGSSTPFIDERRSFGALVRQWLTLFVQTDRKARFALTANYEEISEKAAVLAATALTCYLEMAHAGASDEEVFGSQDMNLWHAIQRPLLRGLCAFLVETFIVDVIRVIMLERLLGIKVMSVRLQVLELITVQIYLCISVGFTLYLRFVRASSGFPNRF